MSTIPYREGEDPPGGGYVLASDAEGNRFWVRREDLKESPLRHGTLPDDLVKVVRWQWRHLAKYSPAGYTAFEQWERGFLRDTHPEREIAHWTRLTYALLEFTHRNPNANPESIFKALNALGSGRGDLVKPRAVRRELEKLYRKADRRLSDPSNFAPDGRLSAGGHLE
jgi:hypothetical protein